MVSRRKLSLLPLMMAGVSAGQAAAQPVAPRVVSEDFMVATDDPGMELFLRNKRPASLGRAAPDRTLLFVHGVTYPSSATFDLPLAGQSWMDFIAARGFDVWCLDLRGYGRSTRPPAMSRPAGEAPPQLRSDAALADIAAAVAFIRARRQVAKLDLMGWSRGTLLMGRFAAENPGLVERLVLYAPVWLRQGPPRPGAPPMPTGAWRTVTKDSVRRDWAAGVPDAKRAGLVPDDWFEQFATATWSLDPHGANADPPAIRVPNGPLVEILEHYASAEPFYDPGQITAPTLLVGAEWDVVTPPYMAAALFSLLASSPGKRLVTLADGTHAIFLERNRNALFQAVQLFLEES